VEIRRDGLPNPSGEQRGVEAVTREIGKRIGSALPPGWGFGLTVFQFGTPFSTWVSNCNRTDMIKALRELADRLEVDRAGGPVAPFSQ